MKAPTKAQEIQILREAAERLGPDSYTGPWLTEQLAYIEAEVACDLTPGIRSLSIKDALAAVRLAARDAEDIVAQAKGKAEAEAAKIIESATKGAARIREAAEAKIRRAIKDMEETLLRNL